MAKHPFLTPEWLDEARIIRAEMRTEASPEVGVPVKANLIITEVPFGGGTVNAHMDTTTGDLRVELEHVVDPDATVTMDYPTARTFVVEQDPQALMDSFMAGRLRIQGDMTKLLAAAAAGAPTTEEELEAAGRLSARLKEITE